MKNKAQQEKIYEITGQFIDHLGKEFWEELYDNLMVDIEDIVPVCHGCFNDNIENTILSVRQNYPDFLSSELEE